MPRVDSVSRRPGTSEWVGRRPHVRLHRRNTGVRLRWFGHGIDVGSPLGTTSGSGLGSPGVVVMRVEYPERTRHVAVSSSDFDLTRRTFGFFFGPGSRFACLGAGFQLG